MTLFKSAALGAVLVCLSAGAAFAQSAAMKAGAITDAAMVKPMAHMSKAEMKKMDTCKTMPSAKMMNDKGCAKLVKMHPDMMNMDAMKSRDGIPSMPMKK